jgi:hypothetical protein
MPRKAAQKQPCIQYPLHGNHAEHHAAIQHRIAHGHHIGHAVADAHFQSNSRKGLPKYHRA